MMGGAGVWNGLGNAFILYSVASGTNGGTATADATWKTRPLNTLQDYGIGVVLASNQFTLPKGTYRVTARAACVNTNNNQLRIYDITNSAVLVLGQTAIVNADNELGGEFTLNAATVCELQAQYTATVNTIGMGNPSAFGTNEIYAVVELTKIG